LAARAVLSADAGLLVEFSIQAWSPSLRKDINCLEQVQRRATKLVVGLKRLQYADRLHDLGLTTLEKRRLRGDLIETFKIVTGRDKVKMEDFLNAVEVSTTSVVTSSR